MKIVFKLTVGSCKKDAVSDAIAELATKHAERLERGRNARHPFNDNQSVKYCFDTNDDLVVAIEGQRHPLIKDGLIQDFKDFVEAQFGQNLNDALSVSQATWKLRGGIVCLEYCTNDNRLEWDQSLADYLEKSPDCDEAQSIYLKAVTAGDISVDRYNPKGRLIVGKYTPTEMAAIYAVLNKLDQSSWMARAEAAKAFKKARDEMVNAFR